MLYIPLKSQTELHIQVVVLPQVLKCGVILQVLLQKLNRDDIKGVVTGNFWTIWASGNLDQKGCF